MASGAPDWWNRSKTDIIAQALTTLNVDLVAQTIGNLAVDIAAQSLSEMNINISKQDLAQVAVELATNSLGNLTVDVNAQSIGNLAIDVAAQTLGSVTVRPFYTETKADWGSISCSGSGATTSLKTINGQGKVHSGYIGTTDGWYTSAHLLYIDGSIVASDTPYSLLMKGHFSKDEDVMYLTAFDVQNKDYWTSITPGLTFESSLELKVTNEAIYAVTYNYSIVWSETP